MNKVRIGYIGVGRRGRSVLNSSFSRMADVEIVTICDKYEPHLKLAQKALKENAGYEAILTDNAEDIFRDNSIDAVVIMTGWDDRIDLVIDAMRAGKPTAFEVGCAFTLEECFKLLEAYKETKVPVMMLENCCYAQREMMMLNLAEQGLFGEIVHCEGGYHHYLNECELFKNELSVKEEGENELNTFHHYRIDSYIERNCENYPTHELGPLSKLLKINRGNRMVRLNAVASKACGLKAFAEKHLGEDSYYANIDYAQGDVVTTIITCENGETIKLALDTTLPRAHYSRNFTVHGTEAFFSEEKRVLYFEGEEENKISDNEEEMFKKYDHPLWEEYSAVRANDAHGGLDYLVCRAFVESVKAGTEPPIDIYDAVLWLSIAPLTEESIRLNGAPVEIPDFTEGKWKDREPVVEGKYCLDKVCKDENVKIYPEEN